MDVRSVYTNSLYDCVRLEVEIKKKHRLSRLCAHVGNKYVFSYFIKEKS